MNDEVKFSNEFSMFVLQEIYLVQFPNTSSTDIIYNFNTSNHSESSHFMI